MSEVAKIEQTAVVAQNEAPAPINMEDRLIAAALNPEMDMERMSKMLDMAERMKRERERDAFNQAIAAAKAEIPPIIKNRTVDFTSTKGRTHYKHEDLAGIARTIDPILSKYGLSYRYRSKQHDGGMLEVTCVLSHRAGYSEETSLTAGRDDSGNKNNFQAVGSAATYLQRYTLKLALGLAAAHDDDAGKQDDASTISADQYIKFRDRLEEAGADEAKFLKAYAAKSLEEFPAAKFDGAMKTLARKMEQANG